MSLMAGALVAGGASAAEAPETPIATANDQAAPADRTTAAQIEDYLRTSPAATRRARPDELATEDRKAHGEVSVGVGTRGYRSVEMRADVPIGEHGRLSVAVGETRGRGFPSLCGAPLEPDEVWLGPGGPGCQRPTIRD